MKNEDLEKELAGMEKPNPAPMAAAFHTRSALLGARTTARWGILLVVLPLFFFACVAIKYYLGWNWGVAGNFVDWMSRMDRGTGTRWISPLLFVVLPGIAALANLAAIMQFRYDRLRRELLVTIRLRWLNLALALICLSIMAMVVLYGIMENAHHRAVEQYSL